MKLLLAIRGAVAISFVVAGACAAEQLEPTNMRSYIFDIGEVAVCSYTVPPALQGGYGPRAQRLSFNSSRTAFKFGSSAVMENAATFYYGVRGDFQDFDVTIDVFAMRLYESARCSSDLDLKNYVADVLAKPVVLKSGERINSLGRIEILSIGKRSVVVAEGADMVHVRTIVLTDGAITSSQPTQWYFVRLNDTIVVGVHVLYYNEKRMTRQLLSTVTQIAESVVDSINVIPSARP